MQKATGWHRGGGGELPGAGQYWTGDRKGIDEGLHSAVAGIKSENKQTKMSHTHKNTPVS